MWSTERPYRCCGAPRQGQNRGKAGEKQMETLYIKGDNNVEVHKQEVTLGDILSMECTDQKMLPKLKSQIVLKIKDRKSDGGKKDKNYPDGRYVLSILKVIETIHQVYPSLEVQNLGAADIIVTYEKGKDVSGAGPKGRSSFLHYCKVGLVMLITFSGAAFSIMAFNNDISITELFSQIYELLTGKTSNGFTVLEFSYSIGIAIGILVFFNHFGKKRFSVDPTPMEVEMRNYENDLQTTVVEMYARKGYERDVD